VEPLVDAPLVVVPSVPLLRLFSRLSSRLFRDDVELDEDEGGGGGGADMADVPLPD
jgi:hypothetical protein